MLEPVTIYFDFASPYAYLSVARSPVLFPERVTLQPVLLGAMFRLRGWGSWADTGERMLRMGEIEDRARAYALPSLVWPTSWPASSLAANRAGIWAARQGAGAAFARALFHAEFAQGADIGEIAVLQSAADRVGLDKAELAEAVGRPEIKNALRQATAAAWEIGVRGVPTTRIGDRLYFGDDQLDEAAASREP